MWRMKEKGPYGNFTYRRGEKENEMESGGGKEASASAGGVWRRKKRLALKREKVKGHRYGRWRSQGGVGLIVWANSKKSDGKAES